MHAGHPDIGEALNPMPEELEGLAGLFRDGKIGSSRAGHDRERSGRGFWPGAEGEEP